MMSPKSTSLKATMMRLLPFLRSQSPLEQDLIERILVVGSGSALNAERAVASMRSRFPTARVALLWPRREPQVARPPAGLAPVITYEGLFSLPALRREVGAGAYDLKVVLFTGEGETLLKLAAFLFPARRMLVFTEGGGSFCWSFDERRAIWNHIKWRLGGGQPLLKTLQHLGTALLNPVLSFIAFIALLFWHAGLLLYRMLWRLR